MNKKINVLGTEYVVIFGNEENFDYLKDNDGYCDYSDKTIVVNDFWEEDSRELCENLTALQNKILRHEIGHAFMYESGFSNVSGIDEEQMVEWMAIQIPKMVKVFEELGIMR